MKRLLSLTETMAAIFLLAIALLIAANVFLRDVLSIQIPDWFDGSKLLQGIALMWGFAVATYYGSHICVDIVWEHLGHGGRRALDVLSTVVTMLFLGATAWMVWVKVSSTGTQTTSDLQLPIVYFYAVAALGVVAAAVLAALRVAHLVSDTPIETPDQEV
jgi:TRAP-type C4-dicarboxylate transport system permease small subunit